MKIHKKLFSGIPINFTFSVIPPKLQRIWNWNFGFAARKIWAFIWYQKMYYFRLSPKGWECDQHIKSPLTSHVVISNKALKHIYNIYRVHGGASRSQWSVKNFKNLKKILKTGWCSHNVISAQVLKKHNSDRFWVSRGQNLEAISHLNSILCGIFYTLIHTVWESKYVRMHIL